MSESEVKIVKKDFVNNFMRRMLPDFGGDQVHLDGEAINEILRDRFPRWDDFTGEEKEREFEALMRTLRARYHPIASPISCEYCESQISLARNMMGTPKKSASIRPLEITLPIPSHISRSQEAPHALRAGGPGKPTDVHDDHEAIDEPNPSEKTQHQNLKLEDNTKARPRLRRSIKDNTGNWWGVSISIKDNANGNPEDKYRNVLVAHILWEGNEGEPDRSFTGNIEVKLTFTNMYNNSVEWDTQPSEHTFDYVFRDYEKDVRLGVTEYSEIDNYDELTILLHSCSIALLQKQA